MLQQRAIRVSASGLLAGLAVGGLFFAGELFACRAERGFLATGWPVATLLPYYLLPCLAGGLVLAWVLQVLPAYRRGSVSTGLTAGLLLGIACALIGAGWQINLRSLGNSTSPPDLYYNIALVVGALAATGLGWWGAVRLGRARRTAPAAFVLALAAAAALGRVALSPPPLALDPGPAPGTKLPNLLLITVDTLRSDHVSGNGYARPTTPTLDRLAAEGVRFSQAVSQSSITIRSMTSLFTSLLPSMHGSQAGLPEGVPDLFSTLREQGYLVAGFATENTAVYNNGIAAGLHHADRCWNLSSLTPIAVLARTRVISPRRYNHLLVPPPGSVVVDKTLAFARRHHDWPVALWVHLMDVHSPYRAPDGFDNRYGPPLASGPSDDALNERLTALTRRESELFHKYYDAGDFESMERELDQRGSFTDAELARLIDLYDGGIAYADGQIDRLLRGLGELGILEDCLTAVTSDHGEGFLEHGRIFHSGDLLYDELIRVPMILHRPGRLAPGTVVDDQVMVVDLYPTVLTQLDIPPPPGSEAFVGRDLSPLLAGAPAGEVLGDNLALSEGAFITSVRLPDTKYLDCPGHDRRELYDLAVDPGEQRNILPRAPDRADAFQALVDTMLRRAADFVIAHPPRKAVAVDDATRERLRALGYIQ